MTTLETLQEDLREKKFMDVAVDIVKYQNYKTSAILPKINHDFNNSTLTNYINCGIVYIKTGARKNPAPKFLYDCIDKAVEKCVQPLRPSTEEKRMIKEQVYTRKNVTLPIAKNEVISKPLTAKVEYGVRINDNIVLQKTEEEARAFMRGINFLNPNNQIAKIVTVELGEVD